MSWDNLQFQINNRHYCRMSTVFMMHWGTCWQTQGIPLFLWYVRRLVFISWLSIVRCSTFIHNTYPHKWDTSILDCLYRGTLWWRLYAIDAGLNARSVAPKYTANSTPIFHSPGGYFTFFFYFLAFILKTRHPSGSGASYIFLTLSLRTHCSAEFRTFGSKLIFGSIFKNFYHYLQIQFELKIHRKCNKYGSKMDRFALQVMGTTTRYTQ